MDASTEEIAPVDATVITTANDADHINTLSLDSMESKIKVFNALNAATSLNDIKKGTSFNVVDVIQVPGIRKGRNGNNDTPCHNTYLICDDDKVLFTQSDGIARSVKWAVSLFPDMGKSAPQGHLTFKVIATELSNGNTVKSLACVG